MTRKLTYVRRSDAERVIRNAEQMFYRSKFPRWTLWAVIGCITSWLVALFAGPRSFSGIGYLTWAIAVGLFVVLAYAAWSAGIGVAGLSNYQHSAKAVWWHVGSPPEDSDVELAYPDFGSVLMACEMRLLTGGRPITLESQVRKRPGLIDVYETNPDNVCPTYNRNAAALWMIRTSAARYAVLGILKSALPFIGGVRLFVMPDMDETDEDTPEGRRPEKSRYCDWSAIMADHVGGAMPIRNLSPHDTPPGIQAMSPFYRYRFTLVPDNDPRAITKAEFQRRFESMGGEA